MLVQSLKPTRVDGQNYAVSMTWIFVPGIFVAAAAIGLDFKLDFFIMGPAVWFLIGCIERVVGP